MTDLRAIAEAATPGPWGWFGNLDNREVYLATRDRGRLFLMRFVRWGMSGAQPLFRGDRHMAKASEVPVFEVAPNATSRDDPAVYRSDIVGFRNPDATYIAAWSPDRALAALDVIEAAEAFNRAIGAGYIGGAWQTTKERVVTGNALSDALATWKELTK